MSKDKKVAPVESAPAVTSLPVVPKEPMASLALPPAPSNPVLEKLSEVDRLALDLARAKRQVALAEAKTALANNENAELNYKYLVLQVYMKYNLTTNDAISEAGDIIRGGAVPPPAK